MKGKLLQVLVLAIALTIISGCSNKPIITSPGDSLGIQTNSDPVQSSLGSYYFDYNNDAWINGGCSGTQMITHNTDTNYVHSGTGSLKVSADLTGRNCAASAYVEFPDAVDMTGKTVSVWILVPQVIADSSPGYHMIVGLDASVDFLYINSNTITLSGWVNVQVPIPLGIGEDEVYGVLVAICKDDTLNSVSWAGDIYYDDISW